MVLIGGKSLESYFVWVVFSYERVYRDLVLREFCFFGAVIMVCSRYRRYIRS